MTATSYRQAFRARRFVIIAVGLLVTTVAVLVPPAPVSYSEPSTALEDVASPAYARYVAEAVLGVPPLNSGGDAEVQFKTIEFYLRSTTVGENFAQRINYTGSDFEMLGKLVTIEADPKTGLFTVQGYGGTEQQAADITNAFTSALRDYLSGLGTQASEQAIRQAQASVEDLRGRIDDLSRRITELSASLPDPTQAELNPQVTQLQAEHDALVSSYTAAYQHLTTVSTAGTNVSTAGLAVLEEATAATAEEEGPSLIYQLWLRVALGLLVGLALGAALALLLEHHGRKVFTRDTAEQAFGARVLAELPRQRLTGTSRDVVVISAPRSRVAEAYRMLRVVLLFQPETSNGDGAGSVVDRGRAIRVPASTRELPAPATTNEPTGAGHRPDLERPRFRMDANAVEPSHAGASMAPDRPTDAPSGEVFPRVSSRSLALAIASTANEPAHPAVVANLAASFAESGRTVTVLRLDPAARRADTPAEDGEVPGETPPLQETSVAGVRIVEWEPEPGGASLPETLLALREDGSVVLVDAGRVATAGFAEVAPLIDGVVAVCQIGRTTIENAERTADIVAWSHSHLLGVVLAQVPAKPVERVTWGRRRRSPLTSRAGFSRFTPGGRSGGHSRGPRDDQDEDARGLFPAEETQP